MQATTPDDNSCITPFPLDSSSDHTDSATTGDPAPSIGIGIGGARGAMASPLKSWLNQCTNMC